MGRNTMPETKPVVKNQRGDIVADSFNTISEAIRWKIDNCPEGYATLVPSNNK